MGVTIRQALDVAEAYELTGSFGHIIGEPVEGLTCANPAEGLACRGGPLTMGMLPYCRECGWTMNAEALRDEYAARPPYDTPKPVGAYFAEEPLLVVAWFRFTSASDLLEAARLLEEASGRDPYAVPEPDEWRRHMVLAWPLADLREAFKGAPGRYHEDADVIEIEGGQWALAYGLGVAFAGQTAEHLNQNAGLADPCEIVGVRVQAESARFAATVQNAEGPIPAEAYGDGSPTAVDESNADNDCGASG